MSVNSVLNDNEKENIKNWTLAFFRDYPTCLHHRHYFGLHHWNDQMIQLGNSSCSWGRSDLLELPLSIPFSFVCYLIGETSGKLGKYKTWWRFSSLWTCLFVCLFEKFSYVNDFISNSFNFECMTFETECTFVYNNKWSKTNSDQHSLPLLHNRPQPPFPGSWLGCSVHLLFKAGYGHAFGFQKVWLIFWLSIEYDAQPQMLTFSQSVGISLWAVQEQIILVQGLPVCIALW